MSDLSFIVASCIVRGWLRVPVSWPSWKYRKRVRRLLVPLYSRRSPVVGLDSPPLDLPKTSTPLLPWEYVEPWSPCLRSLVETGGVICIKGREGQGTAELADYIRRVTADRLERTVFYCGNMPDSTNINIGNVPFLPWRKLLNEILQQWRKIRRRRECRSRVQAERDETTLGMLKELTHPIFHWRLSEIRDLIDNLVLPEDIPRPLAKELNIHQTAHRTVRTGSRPLKSEGGRSSHDASQATSQDGMDAFITSSVAPLQGLGLRVSFASLFSIIFMLFNI